ncbi:MAG: 16S rRNA (guanine(966)-N(2))-methyltransferase RsmD [Planctomycetes bacterium]|nr:16S rRNA (guanine(966)-N(2))-methyltransferase RsmD [Planctomycetota bacterium]
MRIIAGKWRSRLIMQPRTSATRPMPDRVREACFSMLGSHFGSPGALPPLVVADLFAGSGSMGLEALSRGAAHCCFFERQRAALDALRRNIRDLQAESGAEVILRDAWRAAATSPDGRAYDLILLDPPYRESKCPDADGPVRRLLARLALSADARPLVLLHHERSVLYELPPDDAWRILDQRTYGSNTITMFQR